MNGFVFFSVIYGLVMGSFLNLVADRVPKGISISTPPSHCPSCHSRLQPSELIPLLSWVILRGRCRTCQTPIHWQYPVVEAITGLLWGWVAWKYGWSWETMLGLLFVSFLVPLSIIDIREFVLPNKLTYALFALLLLGRIWIRQESFLYYLAGSLVGVGILLFLAWVSPRLFGKEGMGLGDVKLIAGIGLAVGVWGVLLTLFLASLFGVMVGLWLQRSNLLRNGQIPFGPFLALGAVSTYLYGQLFFSWYFGLLGYM